MRLYLASDASYHHHLLQRGLGQPWRPWALVARHYRLLQARHRRDSVGQRHRHAPQAAISCTFPCTDRTCSTPQESCRLMGDDYIEYMTLNRTAAVDNLEGLDLDLRHGRVAFFSHFKVNKKGSPLTCPGHFDDDYRCSRCHFCVLLTC